MLRVYLDQNKWIDLARALYGDERGVPFRDAATVICTAVEAGHVSLPLSSGHMFETRKRRKAESRQSLASVMATVSKNHALAPPWVLLPGELDRAMRRRYGRPTTPLPLQPFGWGLAHRSGHLAPQLSQEIRDAILSADPRVTDRDVTKWIDGVLLEGPPEDLPVGDIPQPPLEHGQLFAEGERAQVKIFAEGEADRKLRHETVAARSMRELAEPLREAQARAYVTDEEFTRTRPRGDDRVPARPAISGRRAGVDVAAARQRRDALAPKRPERHRVLVELLAYCDVLVTERRWAHMYNRTDLPTRLGCKVLTDLADVTEIVVSHSVSV